MDATDIIQAPITQVETLRLEASRELATQRGVFPRIPDTSPAADRYEPITLSAEATLYSFTVIHPSPKSGLPPFVLGYLDFAEDTRVFGRVSLPDGMAPQIGLRLRPVRDAAAGYVFVSLEGASA